MTWWQLLAGCGGAVGLGLLTNQCDELLKWVAVRVVRRAAVLRYADPDRAATRAEEWAALVESMPGGPLRLIRALPFLLSALVHGERRPFCPPGWTTRSTVDTRAWRQYVPCPADDPLWTERVGLMSTAWQRLHASVDAALPPDWPPGSSPWQRLRWRYAATADPRWAALAADVRALRDPDRHFYGDADPPSDQGPAMRPTRNLLPTEESTTAYLAAVQEVSRRLTHLGLFS
jgi:hypothetical protein